MDFVEAPRLFPSAGGLTLSRIGEQTPWGKFLSRIHERMDQVFGRSNGWIVVDREVKLDRAAESTISIYSKINIIVYFYFLLYKFTFYYTTIGNIPMYIRVLLFWKTVIQCIHIRLMLNSVLSVEEDIKTILFEDKRMKDTRRTRKERSI